MNIDAINATSIAKVGDTDLTSLHRRLHQLSGNATGTNRERYWNAHQFVRAEMKARGIKHSPMSWLDEPFGEAAPSIASVMVVPEYLCAVGSFVDPNMKMVSDIDLLFRDTEDRGWAKLIQAAYRPSETDPPLHFVYNPAGPHGLYVPLADLILSTQPKPLVLQVTSGLSVTSSSIARSGTIASGTLFLNESFAGLSKGLGCQVAKLGIQQIRLVSNNDMPYGSALKLSLIPRAMLQARDPLSEAQLEPAISTEPESISQAMKQERHELKIKVLGRKRTEDGRWLYCGSIRMKSGRLQPIETRKKLDSGTVERGWEMASEKAQGPYMLATTFATEERAPLGAIITVALTYLAEWKDDKGLHFSWMDPIVRGRMSEHRQPDTQDDAARIVRATESLWKDTNDELLFESLAVEASDIYMVHQPEGKRFRFTTQLHALGVMTREALTAAKAAITRAPDEETKAGLWRKAGFLQCKIPLHEIAAKIQTMKSNEAASYLDSHLEKRMPQQISWGQVVLRGNAHLDLRIGTPDDHLIGWTVLTPGVLLQEASSGALSYGLNRSEKQADEDWLNKVPPDEKVMRCLKKQANPKAWLTVVTPARPRIEQMPGAIGATEEMAGIFELFDMGYCVYGEQKQDYHEYFLKFDKYKSLTGRWNAVRLADRWLFGRVKEQAPKEK